jgi:dihydrodipicolinate synthase/N-acetylneuraminate lyase
MQPDGRLRPLRGIIPPLATPLRTFDSLDLAGLEVLVEHVLSGQPQALFILGTTGEGPALSYQLRRKLIERVCIQVGSRVPVLVGITDSSYAESLRMAEHAANCGAAAIVVAPPFYLPMVQTDLLRLVESLTRDATLPLYLYNQPGLTKISFTPETVARAAEMPKVWGVKDSSGQIPYIKQVLALVAEKHPEFSVLVGPEHLLAEALRMGAHGGVPGGANIFPKLPTELYRLFLAGKFEEMEQLQKRIIAIGAAIWSSDEADTGYLRRLKCALSVLGLCSGVPSWPYQPSPEEERRQIADHLARHGILSRGQNADSGIRS